MVPMQHACARQDTVELLCSPLSWSSSCLANVCTCANGAAATGTLCVSSGQHCLSCNAGYSLSSGSGTSHECRAYTGTCANGNLVNQSLRTQHNHCGSCFAGYFLNAMYKRCDAFGGSCTNGWLKMQQNRTSHNDCGSCAKGYHLDTSSPKRCIVWSGNCENGMLEVVAERTQENHCGSCDPDYQLNRTSFQCIYIPKNLPSEQRLENKMSANLAEEKQFFTDSNTITLITSVVIIAGVVVIIIMLAANSKKINGLPQLNAHDQLEQGKKGSGMKSNSTYSLEMTSLTPIDEKPINDENPTQMNNPISEASKIDE